MRLFTIRLKAEPERAHMVLAVSAEGLLLIPNDEQELKWVRTEDCLIGLAYRDPIEQAWWDRLSQPPAVPEQ